MKKINFLQYVDIREIETLLKSCGYELIRNPEKQIKPIVKFKKEDGTELLCRVRKVSPDKEQPKVAGFKPLEKSIVPIMGIIPNIYDIRKKILMVTNFLIYEPLEDYLEPAKREEFMEMNKIYRDFMTKKFGKYYQKQFKNYFKECKEKSSEDEHTNE